MMNFTRDERNLMMLYSPGTVSGLREALTQMKAQLAEDEAELRSLADSVLRKLSDMRVVDGWNDTTLKFYLCNSGSTWISATQYWVA